jgi:bis(5'-nucleosyl)-tetraphosphatase (symmetrical)
MPRTIVIGDVHGCLHELEDLVKLVEYRPGKDRLVLVGDIVDRGPFPRECVVWAMENRVECAKGNHEQKVVEFLLKEARAQAGGPPNQMERPFPTRLAEWTSFTTKELLWMDNLPLWIDLGGGWLCVHAGFEPKPMTEQKADRVTRVRWVDEKTGEFVGMKRVPLPEPPAKPHGSSDPTRAMTPEAIAKREARHAERIAKGLPPVVEQKRRPRKYTTTFEQPEHTLAWQAAWKGPERIIYGHAAQRGDPRIDLRDGVISTLGIDTGCVFGYKLTAAIFVDGRDPEFAQVQARQQYYEWPESGA